MRALAPTYELYCSAYVRCIYERYDPLVPRTCRSALHRGTVHSHRPHTRPHSRLQETARKRNRTVPSGNTKYRNAAPRPFTSRYRFVNETE
eukprot:623953-Prymnesium_polylepis.1